jgi:O-antigen/teichoic acid export membrane protein
MIFFGLTPIGSLILPIAASRYASKQPTSSVYLKLILSAGFLGIGAVSLFSLFPDLVVRLLSGSEYLAITSLIPFISLTMFFLSLNQLTLSYLLAVGKEKGTYLLFFFALLQPLLIIFIHSSLYQVITLNLTLQLCLFITLVIYNTLKKV